MSTIINKFGKLVGWNSITTNMLGRDLERILEVSYDDVTELENGYGQGGMPVGRGTGNYSAKCSITLGIEEEIALQRSLPRGKRFSDIEPFDITVEYDYSSMKYKDRIRNVQFSGRSVAVKQGDKTIGNKYDLVVSHIDWNI